MRLFWVVMVPLLVQLAGFGLVMAVSSGGGSFVGLLALSAAVIALPLTTAINWNRSRRQPPPGMLGSMVASVLLALLVPALLLVLKVIEPRL